jgi:hypothetical protein
MTDFKAANTVDTLVPENGRMVVKHYLQDVGSTFGMTNAIHQHDMGWEHFVEAGKSMKRIATFGFALPPWATINYEASGPTVGKFEGDKFDPRKWRTHTPNPTTIEMRDDDAFWAARRIAAFSEEMVRAILHTGELSDPAAERAIGDVMMKRRDKILRAYLPAVNPVVTPRLERNQLSFENAAVAAGVAAAPEQYRAAWFLFDNTTGDTRLLSEMTSPTTTMDAPRNLPNATGTYIMIEIAANSREYQSWQRPVRAYFRSGPGGWTLVGFERMPDASPAAATVRAADERQH